MTHRPHARLRRHAAGDAAPKLGMTPMIDITFLILIFFMCTMKFRTLEGTLAAELPKDVGVNHGAIDELEKLEIRIVVVAQGNKVRRRADGSVVPYTTEHAAAGLRFDHDASRTLEYRVGATRTQSLDEAVESIRRHFDAAPDRRVTLDPKEGTTNRDVVPVLDALLDIGFTDVTFRGTAAR